MASVQSDTSSSERGPSRRKRGNTRKAQGLRRKPSSGANLILAAALIVVGAFAVYWVLDIHARYTLSLQSPLKVRLQWPLVVAPRSKSEEAYEAQLDQKRPLTAYQQYTCEKLVAHAVSR